ncbi:hypothetical protein P4O66_016721, partial [Electrophorus voltai]
GGRTIMMGLCMAHPCCSCPNKPHSSWKGDLIMMLIQESRVNTQSVAAGLKVNWYRPATERTSLAGGRTSKPPACSRMGRRPRGRGRVLGKGELVGWTGSLRAPGYSLPPRRERDLPHYPAAQSLVCEEVFVKPGVHQGRLNPAAASKKQREPESRALIPGKRSRSSTGVITQAGAALARLDRGKLCCPPTLCPSELERGVPVVIESQWHTRVATGLKLLVREPAGAGLDGAILTGRWRKQSAGPCACSCRSTYQQNSDGSQTGRRKDNTVNGMLSPSPPASLRALTSTPTIPNTKTIISFQRT